MEVICLQDSAFYELINEVVERIREKYKLGSDRWISDIEAMALLRITSKTTLQKFRDQGRIRYTQPERKIILYDRESIMEFLNKHAKNPF